MTSIASKKTIYGVNKNTCLNSGLIPERRGDGGILLKVAAVIHPGVATLSTLYPPFVYDYVESNDHGLV